MICSVCYEKLLMWLLVANLFSKVLIHKRTTRFLLVRILYSLMLIIPLLFIVGIVVDVVKLIRFNIFIMYCKYNLHSNNFFLYTYLVEPKYYRLMLEKKIKMWTKTQKMTLRRKMTQMALRRRILTQMTIDLPIFMFSSLVKDIIAFM